MGASVSGRMQSLDVLLDDANFDIIVVQEGWLPESQRIDTSAYAVFT